MIENEKWPSDAKVAILGRWMPDDGNGDWRVIAIDTEKNSITLQREWGA